MVGGGAVPPARGRVLFGGEDITGLPPQVRFYRGSAGRLAIMHELQHLNINTLGIVWNRTPSNYEKVSQVLASMETINPDGSASLYKAGS